MSTQPFFSVIIPTFNRRPFLEKGVNSVLKQTFRDFELIVVDDGSTDDTEKFISSYDDTRLIRVRQANQGVAKARNKALKLSRGKFIAFLDSDDFWVPEKLERALEYIKKFPEIKIFHTEETWYKKGKLLPQMPKHKKPDGFVYKKALPLCCISISTAVIEKEVFDSAGIFDENMEACEDYDFWLRATYKYKVKLIPEYLTIKDGGREDQLSWSIWGLDRFRIKALDKMLLSGLLEGNDYKSTLAELKKKCAIFAAGAEKRGKTEEARFYLKLPEKHIRQ